MPTLDEVLNAMSEDDYLYDEVQYYEDNLDWIASMFNKYFPNTAVCTTVGNHDKKYNNDVPLQTNEYLSTKYKTFISASEKAIVRELIDFPTNYALDFEKWKIRLIFISGYDAADTMIDQTVHNSTGRWKRFMNIDNASEWMIGTISHTPYASDNSISFFLTEHQIPILGIRMMKKEKDISVHFADIPILLRKIMNIR